MPDEPWDRALEEALREMLSGSPDTVDGAPANHAAHDAAARSRPAREAAEREVPGHAGNDADAEGRAPGALARRAAEEGARAAFRAARDAGLHTSGPTRPRDDWSPAAARRCPDSALRAVVAGLLASLTLGGVALATGGLTAGFSDPPAAPRPARSAPHERASGPVGTETGRPGSPYPGPLLRPDRHGVPLPAENREALCHAVGLGPEKSGRQAQGNGGGSTGARGKDQDRTLESTVWRRLVTAAGGEERVVAYCHREPRPDQAADAADPPATANPPGTSKNASKKAPGKGSGKGATHNKENKANKADKSSRAGKPEKRAKGAEGDDGNAGGRGNGGAKQSSGGAS
ncbi:hypothetical protein [Streptomyces sp. MS191]|uniref:hypothetical protein n=1 Tax=Streptomyces sp. ms191 TaxID=1827978 RepID=UPI0011CDB928|nr:hypothetical protein [Streptomyces sp. ms191]